MRGRWAAGIVPRNFAWIIKDRLAVSERPGGYARNHRKVRRQEELFWLRAQHFDRIVSLLGSTHNLHAYDELGLGWSHFPMPIGGDVAPELIALYPSLYQWLRRGERLIIHQDELGDHLMGVIAGYLLWSGLIPDGPRAITATEQLLKRQMGATGRQIVAIAQDLPGPAELQPPPPPAPVPLPPDPDADAESVAGRGGGPRADAESAATTAAAADAGAGASTASEAAALHSPDGAGHGEVPPG